MQWFVLLGVALGVLGLIAGAYVGYRQMTRTGLERLADRDPQGAKACEGLARWLEGTLKGSDGKPVNKLVMAASAAEFAKDSTTPAIKATAGDDLMSGDAGALVRQAGGPLSLRLADVQRLYGACDAAGVEMPAYHS